MNPYGITASTIDYAALHAWTAANLRARRAYYGDRAATDDYAQRTAASQKQLRYRARKKEQQK